jgi:TRAP-type C4-dicarboxylate transport system permease small subunit
VATRASAERPLETEDSSLPPVLAAASRICARLEYVAIIVIAIPLVASVTLQVISRYFGLGLLLPLAWTDELARSLMPWLTFIGAAILERNRDHIRVTIITDLLGRRSKAALAFLGDALCAIFLVVVLFSSFETLQSDWVTTLLTMPVSLTFVSLSLTVGSLAMLCHIALRLLAQTLTILRTTRP